MQREINWYWDNLAGSIAPDMKIGVGEIVFSIIGILLWADTLATLLIPEYRTGLETLA